MNGVIETDVLVVGGGGAGCRAAIEARDQGADVLMIVKGRLGHSGCTLNVGTSAAVGPWGVDDDSKLVAMRDLLAYGGFLGNQELVKILADESPDRVLELKEWGIDFERNDDGTIAVNQAVAHTYPRNFTFRSESPGKHDYGYPPGIAMMDVLIEQMSNRGIRVMNDVVLVDLLKADGKITGATALDCRMSKLVAIKAGATVLATGSYSQIFSATTVSPQETGDGQAAAFRAGADLIDMENTQFLPTTVGFRPGSVFLNARGERFLERYGIGSLASVTKEQMSYAVWKEIREGRGTSRDTIFIDMTEAVREGSMPSSILSRIQENLRERGSVYPGFQAEGFDPGSEPFETSPLAHTTTGGIRINEKCESSVPGLFAAGAVAGGVYGHARPEGYTSMVTLVFGKRAGLFAAQYSKEVDEPHLDNETVQASLDRATALIERTGSLKPRDLKAQVQAAMRQHAWVIKDEDGLKTGLETIREIRDIQRVTAPQSTFKARARDGYEWATAIEVPNMLLCSELMLLSAIERKESRGAFFRDDYPLADNVNWLKNIVCRQLGGEPVLETASVDLKYCRPD